MKHQPIRMSSELRQRSNIAAGTAASILDVELERCIKTKMRPLDKQMKKELFRGYGPLSTFRANVDLAFALDITTPEIHAELNKIRSIRNKFAHETQLLSLDREPIRPSFDSLKPKFAAQLLDPT